MRIVLRPVASSLPLGSLAFGVGTVLLTALELQWVPLAQGMSLRQHRNSSRSPRLDHRRASRPDGDLHDSHAMPSRRPTSGYVDRQHHAKLRDRRGGRSPKVLLTRRTEADIRSRSARRRPLAELRSCRCERVPPMHSYAELASPSGDQQCSERYVAEHWYPPSEWARSPNIVLRRLCSSFGCLRAIMRLWRRRRALVAAGTDRKPLTCWPGLLVPGLGACGSSWWPR